LVQPNEARRMTRIIGRLSFIEGETDLISSIGQVSTSRRVHVDS
jgi:hypothetical protein